MAANLQYRISRGVNNHRTSTQFLFSQFIQDLGTAGTLISNHTFSTTLFQCRDQFRRKSGICKSAKRCFHLESHHLPVSRHGIFAAACLCQSRKSTTWRGVRLHSFYRVQIKQSQSCQVRNMQRSYRLTDMSKCIHTNITKRRGIRHSANSK